MGEYSFSLTRKIAARNEKTVHMIVALAAITVLLLGNSSTKAKSDNEPTISAHMVGLMSMLLTRMLFRTAIDSPRVK